ncbi:AAA family ATPase [Aquidulcibacter paucihalophilus]|uniref:AAA family ATPase n=1 Tax=Aquidulcibacter paucihalophilus TaxID=1978549 RepID=UPI000A18CACF|nr:AAA family ATPase [Aquidulcibacter paucihalophilus]
MHPYEAAILGDYARTILGLSSRKLQLPPREAIYFRNALCWLATYHRTLGVPQGTFGESVTPEALRRKLAYAASVDQFEASFGDVDPELKEDQIPVSNSAMRKAVLTWTKTEKPELPARKSPLQRRIDAMSEAFGLSSAESRVLGLLLRINTDAAYSSLCCGVFYDNWDQIPNYQNRLDMRWLEVAMTLGLSASEFEEVTDRRGRLRRIRLVSQCLQDAELSSPILRTAQVRSGSGQRSIVQDLIGRRCKQREVPTKWEDFKHLAPVRDVALRLIQGALADNAKGVVILLHGPPGTGKSAFAQTLVAKAGAKTWMVGEADSDGDEASRSDRIAALSMASALTRNVKDAVLVFDEADDVFNDGAGGWRRMFAPARKRDGSKIYMNQMLEELASPTILIVNDAGNLGDAVLRRMSLSIEIKTPSAELSAKIAQRILAKQKLKVPPETLAALAEDGTPPAVVALAARAAKLAGGYEKDVTIVARSVTRTLDVRRPASAKDLAGMGFDPAFAQADCDLAHLADQAVACQTRALSFCLYGLPGTGKSAFAHWIAGRMGLEVIEKRGSDLFGMYVGQTEQNIAEAFQEAADRDLSP